MSIIVVVKKSGRAVIAADTLYKHLGDTKVTNKYRSSEKILAFDTSHIGIAGLAAHQNVFKHLLREHSGILSFNSEQEIFSSYLALHPILKETYFINTTEDNENYYESSQINALIANPYGIFGMYSWREVFEYERFWALGSGFDYAMGSMYSTYDRFETPEEIAETAIKAACEFSDSCGLPITSRSIELIDKAFPSPG